MEEPNTRTKKTAGKRSKGRGVADQGRFQVHGKKQGTGRQTMGSQSVSCPRWQCAVRIQKDKRGLKALTLDPKSGSKLLWTYTLSSQLYILVVDGVLFCKQISPISLAFLAPCLPNPFKLPWGNTLHHVYSCFLLLYDTRPPVISYTDMQNRGLTLGWDRAHLTMGREGREEAWTIDTLLNRCVALWERRLNPGDRWNTHNSFCRASKGSAITCVFFWGKPWSLYVVTPVRHKQTWASEHGHERAEFPTTNWRESVRKTHHSREI